MAPKYGELYRRRDLPGPAPARSNRWKPWYYVRTGTLWSHPMGAEELIMLPFESIPKYVR